MASGDTPPPTPAAADPASWLRRFLPSGQKAATSEIRHAVPLAIAAALVGVVSLVTTVFVAHVLTTEGYGTLVILLGLFLVVSMPGSAVLVGVVRRISAWDARGQSDRAAPWVARVHRIGEVSLVAMAVVMWLIREPVAHALARSSASGVAEILTAGGVWILVSIDRGLLQVRRSYLNLSVNLVLESVMRCALTISMAAELGVEGAALGLLFAELVTAVHARISSGRSMAHPVAPAEAEAGGLEPAESLEQVGTAVAESTHGGRDLAADVFAALSSLALLALLQNLDVIILGKEAPKHSGAYAAISVPAKALVFVAITLVNYLLPEATIRHRRGSHALRQLGHTLLVLAVPCGILLVVVAAAPHELLRLVFGEKFTAASPAFATLVLAMVLMSGTVVMSVYLLGVGWRWVVVVLGAGAGALAGAVSATHGSYVDTTRADLIVQIGLCAAMVVCFVGVHRRNTRRRAALAGAAAGAGDEAASGDGDGAASGVPPPARADGGTRGRAHGGDRVGEVHGGRRSSSSGARCSSTPTASPGRWWPPAAPPTSRWWTASAPASWRADSTIDRAAAGRRRLRRRRVGWPPSTPSPTPPSAPSWSSGATPRPTATTSWCSTSPCSKPAHRELLSLDVVVVVDCPVEIAVERLVGQRGFARDDAEARMAAQVSREERREGADLVIDNSADRAQLVAEVDRVWAALAARAARPR